MHLTPGPLHLLVAVARGGILRETDNRYGPWFGLTRPGRDPMRVHARSVNTLARHKLIERIDDIEWRVAAAGLAWLATKGIATQLEKHRKSKVASPGE